MDEVKTEFADALSAALELYKTIPIFFQQTIYKDAALQPLLKSLGLKTKGNGSKKTTTGTTSAPDSSESKDKILALLTEPITMGKIVEKSGLSSVTVAKVLNSLKAESKADFTKLKTSKIWKKI